MNSLSVFLPRPSLALLLGLACLLPASSVLAQTARRDTGAPEERLFPRPQFRELVPGVERAINADRDFFELTSRHDVVELVAVDQGFDWAKDIVFRHDIWALDFTFKPVRFIDVDLPAADGKLKRKLIWYMVYRVRNPGVVFRAHPTRFLPEEQQDDLKLTSPLPAPRNVPVAQPEIPQILADRNVDPAKKNINLGEIEADQNGEPVRFVPSFLLYSRDADIDKMYMDRIIPVADQAIQLREDPARKLLNTVEISGDIESSPEGLDRSVWGVVTWQDVDPRTDFFSIYVQGLTNAYQWIDVPGKGKWYARKTLRLDFWRPGDDRDEAENEIRFLRSMWVYLDADFATQPK